MIKFTRKELLDVLIDNRNGKQTIGMKFKLFYKVGNEEMHIVHEFIHEESNKLLNQIVLDDFLQEVDSIVKIDGEIENEDETDEQENMTIAKMLLGARLFVTKPQLLSVAHRGGIKVNSTVTPIDVEYLDIRINPVGQWLVSIQDKNEEKVYVVKFVDGRPIVESILV